MKATENKEPLRQCAKHKEFWFRGTECPWCHEIKLLHDKLEPVLIELAEVKRKLDKLEWESTQRKYSFGQQQTGG